MKRTRSILVGGLALGALLVPAGALADSTYCNTDAQACMNAHRAGSRIYLSITTQRPLDRYTLCVDGARLHCKSFAFLVRSDGTRYSRVLWNRNFQSEGYVRYRARWRNGDQTLGTLTFRHRR